jgi:hypothetical protein
MSLIVEHPYGNINGFFSNCSVRFEFIVKYFNDNKKVPSIIDSKKLFYMYKPEEEKEKDITFDFFEDYNNVDIDIKYEKNLNYDGGLLHMQYKNYKNIDFTNLAQFIKKYFTPSKEIFLIEQDFVKKYNIEVNNLIGIYYRGTDKEKETKISNFDFFSNKINEINEINKKENLKIFVITDTLNMLTHLKNKFKDLIFIDENKISQTNNGIHNENNGTTNYNDIKKLMASLLILSKCKYLIVNSSNCALWTMFFRGNSTNINHNFYDSWF